MSATQRLLTGRSSEFGGPPGYWEIVASGQTPISAGATVTLATVPLPLGDFFVYVPFLTFDVPSGSPLNFYEGNTSVAPAIGSIVYGFDFLAGMNLKVHSGPPATPDVIVNWVLYKVTL